MYLPGGSWTEWLSMAIVLSILSQAIEPIIDFIIDLIPKQKPQEHDTWGL